jgi:hypothetical protein
MTISAKRSGLLVAVIGILAAGIVAVAVTISSGDDRAGAARPFTWSAFLPETTSRDTFSWETFVERGTLDTFERLTKSLVHNKITSESILGWRAVIRNNDRLMEIETLLGRIEGPDRRAVIERLYALLMMEASNPELLLEKLERSIESAFKSVEEDPQNTGRYLAWALTAAHHAAVVAWDRSGDARFVELLSRSLDRVALLRDDVTGRRDEFRNRIVKGWGAERYDPQGRYMNHVTVAGRVSWPMLEFVRIVRSDPVLTERFGAQAERMLTMAREAMDEFADELTVLPNGEEAYYLYRTHNDDVEPVNHMAWAGNALILLHELTGEGAYAEQAAMLARFIRRSMRREEDGSLIWTYWPRPGERWSESPEFLWKARTTAQFALCAHEHEIVFTREDMEAIVRTCLTRFHRPDGRFSARMDEFDDLEAYTGYRGAHLALTPFIVFERFDPAIRDLIEHMVQTRPDAGGWMRSNHGIIAYAWRLGDAAQHETDQNAPPAEACGAAEPSVD